MGAAGIPIPDKATIDGLIHALAAEAREAREWSVERSGKVTASVWRESLRGPDEALMYRLVLTCDEATHEGDMQLAWSPMPTRGSVSVTVDGMAPVAYPVEGSEKMGNGSAAITGPAAVSLGARMPLPVKTLRVSGLFPEEPVEFSFGDLPGAARRSLAGCFQTVASRR